MSKTALSAWHLKVTYQTYHTYPPTNLPDPPDLPDPPALPVCNRKHR